MGSDIDTRLCYCNNQLNGWRLAYLSPHVKVYYVLDRCNMIVNLKKYPDNVSNVHKSYRQRYRFDTDCAWASDNRSYFNKGDRDGVRVLSRVLSLVLSRVTRHDRIETRYSTFVHKGI